MPEIYPPPESRKYFELINDTKPGLDVIDFTVARTSDSADRPTAFAVYALL